MGPRWRNIWLVILVLVSSLGADDVSPADDPPSYQEATARDCKEYSPTCLRGKCVANPLYKKYKNGSRICVCITGWMGAYCDQIVKEYTTDLPPSYDEAILGIDACDPNPCQAGGSCKNFREAPGGHVCFCKDYRTGTNCESNCQYPYFGKTCTDKCTGCTSKICRLKKGCAKCNLPGYFGKPYCNLTDCLEIPCENFGRCEAKQTKDYGTIRSCVCKPGYTGQQCETYALSGDWQTAKPCYSNSNPCREGSTCLYDPERPHGAIDLPVCLCAEGFLGSTCQFQCRRKIECHNGNCAVMGKVEFGEMVRRSRAKLEYLKKLKDFRLVCTCWPGYNGKKCDQACKQSWGKFCANKCGHCKTPPCDPSHGLCPDNKCAENYYGVRCEKYAKTSDQVEQNMGMRIITINDEDDFTYGVIKNNAEAQNLVDQLRIFISESYESHKKNIVGVKDIFIEKASSEFLGAARKSYHASKSDTKLVKTLIKRAPDTPDAKEYDVNFTVAFEGKSDVGGQTASILRQEANNFDYPGVSIVKKSITAGKKRVVKGTSGLISSNIDGMRGVKGVVSLIMMFTICVAVLVLAGWFISGGSQSTSQNNPKKYKQVYKGKQEAPGSRRG